MIAKTRQGGSSGFQTTDLESSNAEHSALGVTDLREKDVGKKHSVVPDLKDLNKSELVPNSKFPEKTKVSQGLVGSRGGLLTKKSTNALMQGSNTGSQGRGCNSDLACTGSRMQWSSADRAWRQLS